MKAGQEPYWIVEQAFAQTETGVAMVVPHIQTPSVRLLDTPIPTADEASSLTLDQYFQSLKGSDLNVGGNAVIFGTYDNLHLGHLNMLRTAAAVCDNLFVGIESQEAALQRKKNSHPILGNDERRDMLANSGVTRPENVFIRTRAAQDIARLIQSGVSVSTLLVGESQNDNPEMIEAVRFSQSQGIWVLAITRTISIEPNRPISSSALHKRGLAKVPKR